MKQKNIYISIFAVLLDLLIMFFGTSSIPFFLREYDLPQCTGNVMWCILFDLLLIFFSIKSNIIFDMPYEIILNRKMVWSLSKNDFKVRYVGSYLGMFWAFINPMVTIMLYWIVFQFAFKSQPVDGFPFVLWLITGLVPWFLVQDSITTGTNALLEYAYLVKKVLFKINVLPAVKIISASMVHIMFMAVVLVIFVCMGYYPSVLSLIQLVYYFVCILALSLAISYITSSIVLFVRDLGQFITVFMQVFMWTSPIMWRIDIVPYKLRWILMLNPAYYIINGYRDSLLYHIDVFQHLAHTFYFWTIVIFLMIIGSTTFNKLRPHFADVL